MECDRCGTANPEVARFCFRCGNPLGAGDAGRGRPFAIQSTESVTQFALISTVMPHADRRSADAYRWALAISALVVLVLTVTGFVSWAILAAALAVPIAYLVYLYDVNIWEEAPLSVVVLLFLLVAAVSAVVSLVFFQWVFDDEFRQLSSGPGVRAGLGSIPVAPLLLFGLVLPLVSLVVMTVGAAWLARRPQSDDMIDGLTFGVAAGTAYAAAETVVAFWSVISSQGRITQGIASWVVVVPSLMIVKSLIYGTSAGIVAAAFSGRGEGYAGLKRDFFANLGFAAVVLVAYWLGVRLLAYLEFGSALGLVWGLVVLAVLVARLRSYLQTALLEAAVEDVAEGKRHAGAVGAAGFCPACEMPLLPDSMFCIVCGQSVRAATGDVRRSLREPVGGAT